MIGVDNRATRKFAVAVGQKGRVVLPLEIRQRLRLSEGDRIILEMQDDGSIRVTALRDDIGRAMGLFAHIAPGVDLAEELIADRRRDAERE